MIKKIMKKLFRRFGLKDRTFIFDIVPKKSVCCEIGIWKGDFSQKILENSNPTKMYLIDPWKYRSENLYSSALYGGGVGSQAGMDDIYNHVKTRFRNKMQDGTVEIVRERSDKAVENFTDGYFDWIYIDGDHSYDGALGDLRLYCPKVRSGGYIVVDDYGNKGWWKGGVIQAVADFMKSGKIRKVKVKHQQCILMKI